MRYDPIVRFRLRASILLVSLAACGGEIAPQIVRGRISMAEFPVEPAIESVAAIAREGAVARGLVGEDGGFVLAIPAGEMYRLAIETRALEEYPLFDVEGYATAVGCVGGVHDLGAIAAVLGTCCDSMRIEVGDCLGTGARCEVEQARLAACLEHVNAPECVRVDGAQTERRFSGCS